MDRSIAPLNIPLWLYYHLGKSLTPGELAIVNREWFVYSQVSFSRPLAELEAEARAILAIEVGA